MKLTITREELVEVAERTLKPYRALPQDEREKLMEVALTADVILLGGWRMGNCGCLVGTAFPGRIEGDHIKDGFGRLLMLGIRFDSYLRDALGATAPLRRRHRIKVID